MKTLQDLYPDSKRLKVKITDSVQLQRAINYTRRRKIVLSSETSFKKKKMYMLYKHTNAHLFCDASPRLHIIRNYVEKVTLDVGFISPYPPSSESSDTVVLSCKLIEL